MSCEWRVRPYEYPAFVRDVTNPHPKAGIVDVGDNVILYLEGDDREEDICVRVAAMGPEGRMSGAISRSNRLGVAGDKKLAEGAYVEFEYKNIFRLEKATTGSS